MPLDVASLEEDASASAHDNYWRLIGAKGIKHRISRRGTAHGSGLGKHRYIVEHTIALPHWSRRLHIR
ncbi:hypothetical protein [Actinomadura rudentiformis]|uniref:Uncharacterized protein n=1 Tax=Actinomadura rudentiformis TaxID=359158 RepID=A0A6H9Z1B8_9ACTN|nr:hypothetical protein [Actinomadura rudentiformis]KAB2346925.1 hypothetical protein F8566_22290 [Actinomadura rudentiformis]